MKFRNRINIGKDFLSGQIKTRSFPTEYVLEVSSKCNLRCTMCPIHNITRPTGFMQPDIFKKIVSRISPYAELVYLIGAGEPLLNGHFIDYLSYLRKRKIPVGTSTNCVLLTRKISEKLLHNDISYVIFPIDGITKKTYETIRQGSDFDLIIKNIKDFLSLKKRLKKKTFVQVQMISMKENENETKDFPKFIKEIDVYNQINDIRVKPLIDFTKKTPDKIFNNKKTTKACFLLWRNMFISHEGKAFVCCQDVDGSVPIGDFRNETLEEIWNSGKMRSFRDMHVHGKMRNIPLCAGCDLKQEYFNLFTITATSFFDAATLKRYISRYEKYFLLGN